MRVVPFLWTWGGVGLVVGGAVWLLAGTLPAGGDALAIIGIVFLVLIILEVVGVIDIFKKA